MSAKSALAVLVDPKNRSRSVVTIPEGFTVDQIVATLAKKTKFSKRQYTKVLDDPSSIGLPSYAKGNAEGYLFPATYELPPNATPEVDPHDDGAAVGPGRAGGRPRGRRPAARLHAGSS